MTTIQVKKAQFNQEINEMAVIASQARQAGFADEFTEADLWKALLPEIRRNARKMKREGQDPTDAMFAYEIAFTKALENYNAEKGNFTGRLHYIAKNAMGNLYQKYDAIQRTGATGEVDADGFEVKVKTVSFDAPAQDKQGLDGSSAHETVADESANFKNAKEVIGAIWVAQCLDAYRPHATEKDIEVLDLIFVKGIEENQLHEYVDGSAETVKKRKNRAKAKFTQFIKENGLV